MSRLIVGATLLAAAASSQAGQALTAPSKLVVIGNSLTRHPPSTQLQWPHDWGMAASSQERDFAHLLAAALHVPLEVRTIPNFESEPAQNLDAIAPVTATIDPRSLVVIELGDNARPETMPAFLVAYGKLLAATKGQRLVCLSTWWNNTPLDAQIKKRCEEAGGRYVYIGNIRNSPLNPDLRSGRQYAVAAVNDHPHDWGMARIAERIVDALQEGGASGVMKGTPNSSP